MTLTLLFSLSSTVKLHLYSQSIAYTLWYVVELIQVMCLSSSRNILKIIVNITNSVWIVLHKQLTILLLWISDYVFINRTWVRYYISSSRKKIWVVFQVGRVRWSSELLWGRAGCTNFWGQCLKDMELTVERNVLHVKEKFFLLPLENVVSSSKPAD